MEKNTEQIILETARKHFVQRGFAGARMQEIADEASINKAMLHYYFRTKEKLYQAVVNETLGLIIPKIAGAMAAEGSFWERTDHLVDTYIQTILKHPDIPIFIMSELSQEKESFVAELKKQATFFPGIQAYMQKIILEMEEGKIRKMPAEHLLLNILGMTVFPFLAKPVFKTVFQVSEKEFNDLMTERKEMIMQFLKRALAV